MSDAVRVDPSLAAILPRYLEICRADCAALLAAARDRDLESARLLGHRLKGSGGSYGLPEISRLGGEAEAAALAGRPDLALALARELARYMEELDVICGEEPCKS
ncbi:MAG TPA: Hpt domain-containing protein [Desulfovibrio sp.]|jgi:HPt (histidine-containing phosphotransfer) domain-containing protein|uniref:Hpt domain-containing protein n=1 Tax=Desulfovibrio TaxID=872 RepID=UPI002A410AAF|nr:Hpt domain-containing protein [Desulfovibrio sp.]MDY0305579.1 Hpt domain-containing protein [Desulfovibrionaceae bacterium]HMM39777.1 Hpt domain-containing protein [Desulfovibrio sp.]